MDFLKNFLHNSFHIWMLYYGRFMPTLKNKTHPNVNMHVHFWAHLCDHFQSPKSNQVGSTSVAAFHAKDNIKICNPIIFPFSWLCSSVCGMLNLAVTIIGKLATICPSHSPNMFSISNCLTSHLILGPGCLMSTITNFTVPMYISMGCIYFDRLKMIMMITFTF